MGSASGNEEVLRVIVAGGGTGGHLFPGLAVATALGRRRRCEVTFVGSSRGIETRVVPRHGFPLRTLPVRALRGLRPTEFAAAALRLPASFAVALRVLGEIRPHLVIGVGGYASAPAVIAAWLRRLPRVLLEQNAHPGFTNRFLARFADRICVAFPESRDHFPADRTIETGNPVRPPAAVGVARAERFSILVFGGSAGAHRLNVVVPDAIAVLTASGGAPIVLHQTGTADLEAVRERYRTLGVEADVRAFIDDMATAYAAADLVVCRSGATTLAELTALGKPSLLVPYPFAADDHQRKNAESLVRRGAALMILDRDLTAESVAGSIARLRNDRAALAAMAEASRALGRPDAAERVVDVCLALVEGTA